MLVSVCVYLVFPNVRFYIAYENTRKARIHILNHQARFFFSNGLSLFNILGSLYSSATGSIADSSTADIAVDSYNDFKACLSTTSHIITASMMNSSIALVIFPTKHCWQCSFHHVYCSIHWIALEHSIFFMPWMVAIDARYRWIIFFPLQRDIKLLKNMGVKHYRISLSWSRILPGV